MKKVRIFILVALCLSILVSTMVFTTSAAFPNDWFPQLGSGWILNADNSLSTGTPSVAPFPAGYNEIACGNPFINDNRDYTFEAEFTTVSTGNINFTFKNGNPNEPYKGFAVQVNTNGTIFHDFTGATPITTLPGSGSPENLNFTAGAFNKIKVVCAGNTVTVYINNIKQLDNYTVSNTSAVGLLQLLTDNISGTATFRNIKITDADGVHESFTVASSSSSSSSDSQSTSSSSNSTSTSSSSSSSNSTPTNIETKLNINWFSQPNPNATNWGLNSDGSLQLKVLNADPAKIDTIALIPPGMDAVNPASLPKDLVCEVDVKVPDGTTGAWSGIYFRASVPQNGAGGYLFHINTGGLAILDGNTGTAVVNKRIKITGLVFDEFAHIKVELSGATMNVWVNGVNVYQKTDTLYNGGYLGLSSINYKGSFRNYSLTTGGKTYVAFSVAGTEFKGNTDSTNNINNVKTGDNNIALISLSLLLCCLSILVVLRKKSIS